METKLGKIEAVSFGLGGYQGCMLGISFTLGDGSWGVGDFKGNWDCEQIKCTEHTQWTEEDRSKSYDETMRYVSKLLKEAKVDIVTIGQYLQPSKKHLPVKEFITPEQFAKYEQFGLDLGFRHVESGPLVRSSYKAQKHIL